MDDQTLRTDRRLARMRCAAATALVAGLALGALVALALGAPAPARAADLTVRGTCYASRQGIIVSGTAFTPGGPVSIAGDTTGAAQADPAGAFTTEVVAPVVTELGPRTVTITAVDRVNPTNMATLKLKIVREAFGSNLPVAGRPRERTTWRFAGFVPHRPIYAHFVLGGRERGRYRFGVAQGDCGTLAVHAPRIPGVASLAPGRWTLKLDQRMGYRKSTPGSAARFRIVRRPAA
jgi:hypothetical protein